MMTDSRLHIKLQPRAAPSVKTCKCSYSTYVPAYNVSTGPTLFVTFAR
jgi:hypothetical protein